jgi:hypothetical protein
MTVKLMEVYLLILFLNQLNRKEIIFPLELKSIAILGCSFIFNYFIMINIFLKLFLLSQVQDHN